MDLYKEEIMDHVRNPRNRGRLDRPDFSSGEYNPSCGDNILFQGRVDEYGHLKKLMFEGKGCALSLAVASMLTQLCKGKSIDKVLAFDRETIVSMLGNQIGPTRMKCAMLPLLALQSGIASYKEKRES